MARVGDPARWRDRPALYQLAAGGALLVVWVVLTRYQVVRPSFLPGPGAVWRAALAAWSSGVLPRDLLTTLQEMGLALGLSCAVGIPAGVVLGLLRPVKRAVEPLLGLLLTAPLVAFVAMCIIWFGFGSASVVALGFLAGVVNVVLSTSLGVEAVDRVLLNMGRVFCRSHAARFWKVILPAALPTVATGVKFATGRVVVGVIVGEMFGSSAGLGARLVEAANFFDTPTFYVSVFALALTAFAVTSGVGLVETRVGRFRSAS